MRHPMSVNGMPEWLQRMLIAKGVMTESGLFRKARIQRHRGCGLPILAGLDADLCALEARCDVAELTAEGEALALLAGRRTYELDANRHLHPRNRYAITRRSAQATTVLVEHHCDTPTPASWTKPTPPPFRPADVEEIPF